MEVQVQKMERIAPIQSVERAIWILKCFESHDELTLSEISRALSLHKSTTFGLVSSLEAYRLLEQDQKSGKYRLGIEMFRLGNKVNIDLRSIVAPYLDKLVDICGETVNFLIPDDICVVYLEEGAFIQLDTTQIKGVDDTKRYTKAVLGKDAEIVITEKLLTHDNQYAESEMDVFLNGEGSKTRVISRSVAQDNSVQVFYPRVEGNAPCFGHVSCDAIIMGEAKVKAIPAISCNHVDAGLIHEAAIGKIAGDQLLKLMTLGLTAEEAEEKILEGFLR